MLHPASGELLELGGGFDPFGDDPEVEIVSDADDRPDHDAALIGTVLVELVDEAAVDLEVVDGKGA